jgi:hypothetical protein
MREPREGRELREGREPREPRHTPQFLQRSAATQRVEVVEDEFDDE